MQTATLQTADQADGMGGTDRLIALFNNNSGGNVTVVPTLTNIEEIYISDFSPADVVTLDLNNSTGVTDIASQNSTDDVTVDNIGSLVDAMILNTDQDLNLTFLAAATNTAADVLNLTLSNTTDTGGTFRVTSQANGIETLSITSQGAENSLAAITQTTGTTLDTINVSGDQICTVVAALPATVLTTDASGMTGGGFRGIAPNVDFTFTGGAGDDFIGFGAGEFDANDSVDGGDGDGDKLRLASADADNAAAELTNVSNIEILGITNSLAGAVTSAFYGAITEVHLEAGLGNTTLTVPSGTTVRSGLEGADNDSAGGAAAIILVAGAGTSDTLDLVLDDSDFTGAVDINGVETVNLESNIDQDGSAADGGGVNNFGGTLQLTPTFGTGTLNISGTEAVTFTGATTVGVINGSGFDHAITMAANSAIAAQITGGNGDDQLLGSANNDIIAGGAGDDTLAGGAGADILTGGDDTDTIEIQAAAADGADRKSVTDFDDTPDTGDIINIDTDLATLGGTDNFATTASLQAHTTAGAVTIGAAAEMLVVTSGTVANLEAANGLNGTDLLTAIGGQLDVTADQDAVLAAVAETTTGRVGIYLIQESADGGTVVAAADATLVAILDGADVTIAGLVFNNFTNANNL